MEEVEIDKKGLPSIIEILTENETEWSNIISERTSDVMKGETANKFASDKSNSNACKRLHFVQTLFAKYTQDEYKENQTQIAKPIDNVFEITPLGKCTKIDIKSGIYSLSSEGNSNLNCKSSLKTGRWYYEIELMVDPNTYNSLHVGFANDMHSNHDIVGVDANSYGYAGVGSYGKCQWKAGDTIGITMDLSTNNSIIECYLNGQSQGIAFENIKHCNGLFPGFTLSKGEQIIFINDETKFSQTIPNGYIPIIVDTDLEINDIWNINGVIDVQNDSNGIKLTAVSSFSTAILKRNNLEQGNRYYYEIQLESSGCMQVGVADGMFEANDAQRLGVGDDSHSWSIDLNRMMKWTESVTSASKWKKGDIIGCLLDIDNRTISYSLNGKDIEFVISNINVGNGLHPAISIRNVKGTMRLLAYLDEVENQKQDIEEEKIASPKNSITYVNIMLGDAGCKYKPSNQGIIIKSITDDISFKAMDICNGLKEYSYDQYKEDYYYIYVTIDDDDEKRPDCICNAQLQKVKAEYCFNLVLKTKEYGEIEAVMCNGCEEIIADREAIVWHCLNTDGKAIMHREKGYSLCKECGAEEVAKQPPTFDATAYKANQDDTYTDCLFNYLSLNGEVHSDFIQAIRIFLTENEYDSDCIELDIKSDDKQRDEDSNIYKIAQIQSTNSFNHFNVVKAFVAPSQKEQKTPWDVDVGSKQSKYHFINFDSLEWKCLKGFGYQKEYHSGSCYSLSVHFFPVPPDCCKPSDIEAQRRKMRESLAQPDVMGGILSCETININGIDCLEQLIRIAARPHGTILNWSITVPFEDRSYVIRCNASFNDLDIRELQSVTLNEKIYEDPYDPTYKGGIPMSEAEKPEHDMEYWWHPLSQLRMKIIPKLKKSIHFDDEVQKLQPM